MNIEQIRNKLIQEVKVTKDESYRSGYVDGVLDFYLDVKKEASKPEVMEVVGAK